MLKPILIAIPLCIIWALVFGLFVGHVLVPAWGQEFASVFNFFVSVIAGFLIMLACIDKFGDFR